MNNPQPIWIDCDPGIDDAYALCLAAACPELLVTGLSAVAGNVGLNATYANSRKLAAFLHLKGPVCAGAAGPLLREKEDASLVHGAGGLGFGVLPECSEDPGGPSFLDALYEAALRHRGELIVLAVGPLTNLALALWRRPQLKELIKEIRMMGGSATSGNHSPYGEFNVWADPHAAKMVFQSGVPIVLYGLDLTTQTILTQQKMRALERPNPLGGFLKGMNDFIFSTKNPFQRPDGVILHDALVVASLVIPEAFTYQSARLDCETASKESFGQTVMIFDAPEPNASIGRTVAAEAFYALLQKMADYYDGCWPPTP
ncbi:Inosine-uridine preferring nucleoside hydrolase [Clostridiaceae bacterium JG1575]|nr:Inosine-uridine preferring nucleoside hydrolase [Clostridiaceae bacterium JG1575]